MLLLHPLFNTYYEALHTLNFGADVFVVKITADHESLEFVSPTKHIITIIGQGKMSSPGHPTGNQCIKQQRPFIQTLINEGQVPVLYKRGDNLVEYLGMYRLLNRAIKLTNSGFRYYEYKLQRYNKSDMS